MKFLYSESEYRKINVSDKACYGDFEGRGV